MPQDKFVPSNVLRFNDPGGGGVEFTIEEDRRLTISCDASPHEVTEVVLDKKQINSLLLFLLKRT